MKKSFSKLNLLSQDYISPFKNGVSRWFQLDQDYAILSLTFPYYDYLRGQVFIDDLRQVYEGEVSEQFDFIALLTLLHDDFLSQMQKGVRSHKDTAEFLMNSKLHYFKKTKPKPIGEMRQVKSNTFIFDFEEEEEEVDLAEEDNVVMEMTSKKSKIQRTEILLYDLSQHMEKERVTVEQLITLLYLDFIYRIKKEGNDEKVMRNIIRLIEK